MRLWPTDMQIEEVGVRYVTSVGEPWLRGQHLPLLYDYFTRPRSPSASRRWNRGEEKNGEEKDRGKMIVYDGLDVTMGVIDAPRSPAFYPNDGLTEERCVPLMARLKRE